MGVAGWRFEYVKRNLSGGRPIVAVLEDLQVICSAMVAAGSMIMLGIMLYTDWPQQAASLWAFCAKKSVNRDLGPAGLLGSFTDLPLSN